MLRCDLSGGMAETLGLGGQGMAVDLRGGDSKIAEIWPGLGMAFVVVVEDGLHYDCLEGRS